MRRLFTSRVAGLLAAVCSIFLSEGLSLAQAGSRPYPVGRRVEEQNRQAEQYDREEMSRSEKKGESPDRKRTRAAAAVQVREDFGRIQSIHNEIVLGTSAGKTLDGNFISDALEAINKSASRLKSNLALPRIDDKEKRKKQNEIADVKFKSALTLLCGHISNFVTNPLFESSGVLDVELSIRASRDLDEIIELSDNLRRKAEKLKRN